MNIPIGIFMTMSKRDELLSAALKMFSSDGYENVGVQKIVDVCDVGKPTLYHYFGSKQGLLSSLCEIYFNEFFENLKDKCEFDGDVTKGIENIVTYWFYFASKYPEFYRFALSLVYSSELSEARKTILPWMEKQQIIVEKYFRAAGEEHGNMKGRSLQFTITFIGMINSFITSAFYKQVNLDSQLVYEASRQFMYGIFS